MRFFCFVHTKSVYFLILNFKFSFWNQQNGYPSRRRSLVDDARFESQVVKQTKETVLEEAREKANGMYERKKIIFCFDNCDFAFAMAVQLRSRTETLHTKHHLFFRFPFFSTYFFNFYFTFNSDLNTTSVTQANTQEQFIYDGNYFVMCFYFFQSILWVWQNHTLNHYFSFVVWFCPSRCIFAVTLFHHIHHDDYYTYRRCSERNTWSVQWWNCWKWYLIFVYLFSFLCCSLIFAFILV